MAQTPCGSGRCMLVPVRDAERGYAQKSCKRPTGKLPVLGASVDRSRI